MDVSRPSGSTVVWPALLLEERMLTWWAIATGLVVEWPVVKRLTRRDGFALASILFSPPQT